MNDKLTAIVPLLQNEFSRSVLKWDQLFNQNIELVLVYCSNCHWGLFQDTGLQLVCAFNERPVFQSL